MAKILILEPEEELAASLSEAVEGAGWQAEVAGDGSGVMDTFATEAPALVVLDLAVDGGQGVDLCHRIRESEGGELVPILLLGTGKEGVKNFGDALVEGGDYYFEKPFEIHKVVSKIETYVGIDQEAPTVVGPPPASATAGEPRPDLAERVDKMMGLGAAFKDGLLAPPGGEEIDEAGEREQTLKHKLKPDEVGGLLPPDGEEEAGKPGKASFPEQLEPVDEKAALAPPGETSEAESAATEPSMTRIASELESDGVKRASDELDELVEETKAWSKLEAATGAEDTEQADEHEGEDVEKAEEETGETAEREVEERARREAEEKAEREAEEKARREAEEKAEREAEERARREAEEKAAEREAEERARREAEEKAAEREAEERARREVEEQKRQELILEGRRKADGIAFSERNERTLRLLQYKARQEAEEKARREEEEQAKREAEERARREAEERARREAEERARREAEEKARREIEELARLEAEEKARREAEERQRREAEEREQEERIQNGRRKADSIAFKEHGERILKLMEYKARREAEEKEKREAEEKARREAEEKARREAEERARREEEEQAKREAEERARREAEEETRQEAEPEAKPEVGKDEGYLDAEEVEAESLWESALEESRREGAESEFEEKHGTVVGESTDFARLLREEAILARERAAKEPEPITDINLTIPDLPPRPDDEHEPGVGEQAEPRPEDEGEDFQREDTADIRPETFVPDDEFSRPKTSRIKDMRARAREAAGKGAARQTAPTHTAPRVLETDAGLQPEQEREEDVFRPLGRAEFSKPDPLFVDLERELVPAVLYRFLEQEVTGLVTFASGSDRKDVFFESGVPVGVRSNQTADRFEEMLFRLGLIDRAAYAEARIKGIGHPRALAAHLVERGLLRPEEYFPLVRRHFEECLLGLFEWSEASAEYDEQYAPDAEKIKLTRPVPALIIEGIRRKFLLERMVRELGSPSSLLSPVEAEQRPPHAADTRKIGFLPDEREVLRLVNGLRPIEEIVFLSGQNAITVYRVLLAGVIMGLVTVTVRGVRGGAEDAAETMKKNLQIARRRLEAKFAQVNQASYFEILGLGEAATPYEIEAAHRMLAAEFHPMHYAHADLKDLADKLEVVRQTLDEAKEVLTDDLLRDRYRQSLADGGE